LKVAADAVEYHINTRTLMKEIRVPFFFLFLLFPHLLFSQIVVLNEAMASNQATIRDENGDASDWIELYNGGSGSINLSGYGLSDDTANIQKWRFQSATIDPGAYLVVFASGKNRQTNPPHANFKISASGETLLLSDSVGIIVDSITIPASAPDISYGRTSDGALPWIFQKPTPGSRNTGNEIKGVADSISLSHRGGFYSSPISLTLSAGTSRIFYTLDGSVPDTTDAEYTAPISIQTTKVLKAISVKANYLPTNPITNTYFIGESTSLPVISLSADSSDLFDADSGIYTNYTEDWERPAHIEFFEDDKSPGFSEDCGINIVGNQSAEWAQKSLAIKFKKEYGIPVLKYPLFPGFRVKKFNSFVLRNSGNDFQYTHIRDALMQTLVKDLDVDYLEYRPATTFINGQYWGIYNIREKVSEHYAANRYGVDPDNIDMLEDNMTVLHGDSLQYRQLIDYINTTDMSTTAAYDYVNSIVDLDEWILYFAAQAYYDNMDWPGTNIKYWRERSAVGRWRWILFGLDFGFGLYGHGEWEDHIQFMFSPEETRYSNPPWATLLQRKLVQNPIIRNRFINQIADLLNANFQSARVVNTINTLANHIAGEIAKHRARWGLTGENLDKMTSFAQNRPAYLRSHVRNYFGCGADGQITITSTAGGSVRLNSLVLHSSDMPFTGIYFQGNAVHLKAIASPGYTFEGWSGAATSKSDSLSLSIGGTTSIAATFSIDSNAANGIVINEINYHSSDQFDTGDWIELYNDGTHSADIGGWVLTDGDPIHRFTFPAGTVLGSDGYVVLAEDTNDFASHFPGISNFVGEMNFGLSSYGEFIELVDDEGQVIDSLTYGVQAPWPAEANGLGATLELGNPATNNALGVNWRASAGHGSPGRKNSVETAVRGTNVKILPSEFRLFQNYPNPFNPKTVISFQLPVVSRVSLKVYDLLGREVATLVDRELSAGDYTRPWNAATAASGVYFYRLTAVPVNSTRNGPAGSLTDTKKLILLR
jgi:hypothetical protein